MVQKFIILAIVSFCLKLCIGNTVTQPDSNCVAQKTQVVIIGTIHSAHYKNPNYSPDLLKKIILDLKPDAILLESPLSMMDPNGRPIYRDPLKNPEGWASDTVAQQLGIRQIPFDRPDRQENFRKTRYFEREKEAYELRKKYYESILQNEPNSPILKITQLQVYACTAEASLLQNAGPEAINSEAHDSIIRIKMTILWEIFSNAFKYPPCKELIESDQFFQEQWKTRNEIMANNIIKAVQQYPGKRLVVVTGATHRYILRDLLKDNQNLELKEYWQVIPAVTSSTSSESPYIESYKDNNSESIIESNSILHITSRNDWNKALDDGKYHPESLNTDGYIHCSKPSQIIKVANHSFNGKKGLVLLVIEPKKVKPEIKYEGAEPTDLFPHIYGELNLDAVVSILDFPASEDGTFKLP